LFFCSLKLLFFQAQVSAIAQTCASIDERNIVFQAIAGQARNDTIFHPSPSAASFQTCGLFFCSLKLLFFQAQVSAIAQTCASIAFFRRQRYARLRL